MAFSNMEKTYPDVESKWAVAMCSGLLGCNPCSHSQNIVQLC
jgi:hypothetical protein